jgi:hypothetical protein
MKKAFAILIILVLAFSVFKAPRAAYAQGFGTTWDSSFQVMNLSASADAHIQMYYYNPDGSLADMATGYTNPDSDTVLIGRSNTYFPVHAADGFNGSVVVTSDQPIAVISNLVVNTTARGLGSYVAFQNGASKIYFPLVMKLNSSNTTTFNVQNTGSTPADVTVKFYPQAGSPFPPIPDILVTIPMGAAHTYDMNSIGPSSKWIGAVTAEVTDTANDSVAGVATTVNVVYSSAYQLATFNAFTAGATQVTLPLVQENNGGTRSSANCQNVSPSTTATISINYTPGPGFPAKPSEQQVNVPPGGNAVFINDYTNLPGKPRFIGSAVVTASPTVPLVCVVNQQTPSRAWISSYEGFSTTSATGNVLLPLVQSKNGNAVNGFVYTTINLATADGLSHPMQCDFKPAPGFGTPPPQTGSGASVVFFQNNLFGNGTKFIGGAACYLTDASGVGLFAIVNHTLEISPQPIRDTLSSYDGFNQ